MLSSKVVVWDAESYHSRVSPTFMIQARSGPQPCRSASARKRRAGSSTASSARSKVPKCMATTVLAPTSLPDLEPFLGRGVYGMHHGCGKVRPDRDGGEIERPQPLSDLLEVVGVCRIARVVETPSVTLHHPPAPEPTVPVPQRAAGEVASRNAGDLHAVKVGVLPPLQFDGVASRRGEPTLPAPAGPQRAHLFGQAPRPSEGRYDRSGHA